VQSVAVGMMPTGVRREARDSWITRVSNAKDLYKIQGEPSTGFESWIRASRNYGQGFALC